MTVTNVHVLHGVQTPSSFYSQVEDCTPTPGLQALLQAPAGIPWPTFRGVRGVKPEVSFRSTQLTTLLDEAGLTGVNLSAGNTDLYYRKVTNLGTREADASAVHTRLRMAMAFLHWRSITARHQGEASIDCRVLAVYDGTHVPIVAAGSLALAGTSAASTYWALGPVSVNGAEIDGLEDATIELGPDFIQRGSNSEPYDRYAAVRAINPVVSLKGLSLEAWTSYALAGTPLTSLTLYLRKFAADAAGGAYVGDATAQHIKLTASAGIIGLENTTGGGNTEATTALRLYLRGADAATAPLTINTASAIT